MADSESRNLTPAEHVEEPPTGGWSGEDVSEDELVDDAFIAADPSSYVLEPEESDDGA